jgi:hypothetical protein
MWRDLRDGECRRATIARLRRLTPQSPRQWGTMTAPRMVTHLIDQMRTTLGDARCAAHPGILRFWPVKVAAIYLLPWPEGFKGPREMFVTEPTSWDTDLETLERLIERFGARDASSPWPEHPMMGRMSARDWGVFTERHFDHHLRQFGVSR